MFQGQLQRFLFQWLELATSRAELQLNFILLSASRCPVSISRLDWTSAWLKFQLLVPKPGYYKTNSRALRLRELIRWHGWRGPLVWLKTRFKSSSEAGMWMPGLWAENECKPEKLSAEFWQATRPHRADFEKLGFVQCRLGKATRNLNSRYRDSGSIYYLDATRCYFGQLLYLRQYYPSQNTEMNQIVISFTAVFEQNSLSCTNNRKTFDSPLAAKVIRLDSYDVPVIYQRFQQELRQRSDTPRSFPNLESLREWSDTLKTIAFEDRVRRRLFIPMTEAEIKAALAVLQHGGLRPLPPLPRRGYRLGAWPVIIVLLLLVLIRRWHIETTPDNTITYQGQQFKTRLSYASYDDYKDDPNNLDTNELGRIEQTMESVKVPASFKDRKALFDFMAEIEFPGYGWGSDTTSVQIDDGSALDVESFEIPQAGKDRVIVVRESGGSLKLVDDFVYKTGDTNSISRIRLENHELQYFDTAGRLFRKKSLEPLKPLSAP